MTLEEFCNETHNLFSTGYSYSGDYTIANGTIELSHLTAGQYFRIYGSIFNDGVHQYPADDLVDETFSGIIYPMAVPKQVLDLIGEITDWQTANAEAENSPYQSESFDGYSYTKATATSSTGANLSGWRAVFGDRLKPWRKIA